MLTAQSFATIICSLTEYKASVQSHLSNSEIGSTDFSVEEIDQFKNILLNIEAAESEIQESFNGYTLSNLNTKNLES